MRRIHLTFIVILLLSFFSSFQNNSGINDESILNYQFNMDSSKELLFYWKNSKGEAYRNFNNLKAELKSKNKLLVFAMNGGMYKKDNYPQGLYIENGKILSAIDTTDGNGNFYLKPNGVFYLTKNNETKIVSTDKIKISTEIKYATQSGPMLVIDGNIHESFTKGSKNLNIRNGVGILPNNKVLFAMSKVPINFYDFALYFKKAGCMNALYLDGFVSRTYLPEKNWLQTDGNFGVIIAVIK